MAAKNSGIVKKIANERIALLFELAKKEPDPELSKRYAKLIKLLGEHYRIKLPRGIKSSLCKKCGILLIPGKSMTVRLASSKGYVVYKCQNCGTEKHLHY